MTDTNSGPTTLESIQPVHSGTPEPTGGPSQGIALCLSGGGYRAMVFHAGALLRLNQLGILKKLARVSSVSGGSLTAGVLALAWKKLSFNDDGVAGNLQELLTRPIRRMANTTIDQGSYQRHTHATSQHFRRSYPSLSRPFSLEEQRYRTCCYSSQTHTYLLELQVAANYYRHFE